MKKVVYSIILLLVLAGCASMQQVDQSENYFERIVHATGVPKDKIYNSTKMWVAENFRSAKAVLEYEDKESGTIIGNGTIKYPCSGLECIGSGDWKVFFTMRVDIK